jgi:hypothetical protein
MWFSCVCTVSDSSCVPSSSLSPTLTFPAHSFHRLHVPPKAQERVPLSSCTHRRLCKRPRPAIPWSPAPHLPSSSPTCCCCPTQSISGTTQERRQHSLYLHGAHKTSTLRAHFVCLMHARVTLFHEVPQLQKKTTQCTHRCAVLLIQSLFARGTQIDHPTCSFCMPHARTSDVVS